MGFYFAWLEHYTTALMWLMWMAVITRIVADAGNNSTSAAGKTAAAVITPLYAVIVAVWTTLQSEVWKRQTAVLAYKWDVQDFEEEEQPRPEFLRSYYDGFWSTSEKKRQENQVNTQHGTGEDTKGAMKKRRGFYDARKRFVHDPDGDLTLMMEPWKRAKIYVTGSPMLALMAVIMMVVTFAILTFRMIMQVGGPATPARDPTFPSPHSPHMTPATFRMTLQLSKQWESYALFGIPAKTYGGGVGAILNTVWITVMIGEHELTSYCHLLPPHTRHSPPPLLPC